MASRAASRSVTKPLRGGALPSVLAISISNRLTRSASAPSRNGASVICGSGGRARSRAAVSRISPSATPCRYSLGVLRFAGPHTKKTEPPAARAASQAGRRE